MKTMQVSLNTLIDHGVFESYELLTESDTHLPIYGVSILETPDFEKYIVDHTLILTTFYIIKKDLALFKSLLKTLKEHASPGIVIKLHRFIDEIPQEIIDEANRSNITIIGLNYDANLSVIYKAIFAEMQSTDYLERNFHSVLSEIMSVIENNPSTSVFVERNRLEEGMHLLFYNYDSGKITKTDEVMDELFETYKDSPEKYLKINNNILFKDIVEYGGSPAYMYLIYTSDEQRYLLEMYSEIYHILVTFIIQKKRELILQQDRFLTNFISNLTSKANGKDIIEEGKIYNWNIEFPIFLLMVSVKNSTNRQSMTRLALGLKDNIIKTSGCTSNEIKFIYIDNDKILYIANAHNKNTLDSANGVKRTLENLQPRPEFIVSYTNRIYNAADIPSKYRSLLDANNYISQFGMNAQIVPPTLLELVRLTKELDSKELNDLLRDTIRPLIEYEEKHGMPLCETLLTYYQQHFNIKSTAEKLFIHYNTLKYRISIIQGLYGEDIFSTDYDYVTILFALYIHSMHII